MAMRTAVGLLLEVVGLSMALPTVAAPTTVMPRGSTWNSHKFAIAASHFSVEIQTLAMPLKRGTSIGPGGCGPALEGMRGWYSVI